MGIALFLEHKARKQEKKEDEMVYIYIAYVFYQPEKNIERQLQPYYDFSIHTGLQMQTYFYKFKENKKGEIEKLISTAVRSQEMQ